MGKLEKLIELFLRQPPEVRFADVRYLLEAFGYIEQRSKGSRHTFSDPNGRTIVIPKVSGQKVKGIYVKRTIELLELEKIVSSDTAADSEIIEVESEEEIDD